MDEFIRDLLRRYRVDPHTDALNQIIIWMDRHGRLDEFRAENPDLSEYVRAYFLENCPACGSINITTEHLQREWLDLLKHNAFSDNRDCANTIRYILMSRDVTTIPNIFGDIKIRRR